MTETTTTERNATAAAPAPAPPNNAVTTATPKASGVMQMQKARLAYHPLFEQEFGIDRVRYKTLCDSIFPTAKTPDAIWLALSYCKSRDLDIMKRPVHIVPMWNSDLNREVETVWPSITEHRITAHRTREYAGTDETEFGPMLTKHFRAEMAKGKQKGKIIERTVTFPEWARVTVYRIVQGVRVPFPGQKILWLEYYGQTMGLSVPNARWCRAPSQMIEKCAEASALRKAFTEELGGEYTAEEMEGRTTDRVPMQTITPARPEMRGKPGDPAEGLQNERVETVSDQNISDEELLDDGDLDDTSTPTVEPQVPIEIEPQTKTAEPAQTAEPAKAVEPEKPIEPPVAEVAKDDFSKWVDQQMDAADSCDVSAEGLKALNDICDTVERETDARGREDDRVRWNACYKRNMDRIAPKKQNGKPK